MASLNKTPLFDYHFEVGAKMVPVGSWTMPYQFGDGCKAEFMHALESCCITDFGCCRIYRMIEKNAEKIRQIFSDMQVGEGRYCRFCRNENLVDTPLIVRMDENDYLCAFAPSAHSVCTEIFDGEAMQDLSEVFGSIAVWGLECNDFLAELGVDTEKLENGKVCRFEIDHVRCIGVKTLLFDDVSGVMIFCDREKMDDVWIALFNTPGIWAAGFGAWDFGRICAQEMPFNAVNRALPIGIFQWFGDELPKAGDKLKKSGKSDDPYLQVVYSAQLPHTEEAFLLVSGDFAPETELVGVENDGGKGTFKATLAEK